MKTAILMSLLKHMMSMLDAEALREMTDYLLDWIENKAKSTDNKFDDAILLPLCATVRAAFDIPDND